MIHNKAFLKQEFDKFVRMLESGKIHKFSGDGDTPLTGAIATRRAGRQQRRRLTVEEFIGKKEEEGGSLPLNPPRCRKSDPVNRLARTLRRYKERRITSEEELLKIMEKVKIDKGILLKEKIDSIWGHTDHSNFKEVKHEIDKCK